MVHSIARLVEEELARAFINERNTLGQQIICGVCGVWTFKSLHGYRKLTDLVHTGLLSISEAAASRGTATTHGLALYETCKDGTTCAICQSCAADLDRSVVPKFALSSKWNVGVVPVELSGLTVLEQLLITRRFHATVVVTVYGSIEGGNLRFSSDARPFTQFSDGYHAHQLPLSDDMQHAVLAVEFRKRLNVDVSSLPCLRVRSSRVGSALRWLKARNRLYRDVDVVEARLASLPEDGVPASWISQLEGPVAVACDVSQLQLGLERERCNITDAAHTYFISAVQYIDLSSHFILADCFPCIFVDGLGPCDGYVVGDAARLGWWATHHSDPRFENQPSFLFMILQTIQAEQYAAAAYCIPTCLDPLDFRAHTEHGNKLLAKILNAEQSNTKLFGELSGMVTRLGQPLVYLELQVPENSGLSNNEMVAVRNNTPCADVRTFDNYCNAFITTVVGTRNGGLFGKVRGYYGRVQEDHNGILCLHMFLWPLCPHDSDAYDGRSILARGDANNGTFPLSSSGIFRGKLLHESFSTRALGGSTRFQDIAPPLSGGATDDHCVFETNRCYKAFFRPDVAAPVFRVLICESYILAPKDWTPQQCVTGGVLLTMAAGRSTTQERIRLLGGFATGYHSHSFVDVDSEGIFKVY